MQTLDSFLNMTNSNYIPNVIKPDIVFNLSNGIGSDIIYLPESGNLSDFFFSQKLNNMVRTEQIIIPPRMLLSGETIINTKYYEDLRKNLKGFVYSKIVTKLKDKKRSRYFDTTPLVGKMVSISNKKTVLNVYNEFFQKVFSIYTDFDNSILSTLNLIQLGIVLIQLGAILQVVQALTINKDMLILLQIIT